MLNLHNMTLVTPMVTQCGCIYIHREREVALMCPTQILTRRMDNEIKYNT